MKVGRNFAYHLLSSCGSALLRARAAAWRQGTARRGRAPSWACGSRGGEWSRGSCGAARDGRTGASRASRTGVWPAGAACGDRVRSCTRGGLTDRPWRHGPRGYGPRECVRGQCIWRSVPRAGRSGRGERRARVERCRRECRTRRGDGGSGECRSRRPRAAGASGVGSGWAGSGRRRCHCGRAGVGCGQADTADRSCGADARHGFDASEFCGRASTHDAADDAGCGSRSWGRWGTAGFENSGHGSAC